MQFQIHFQNFETTGAIEQHVRDALESLTKFVHPENIHVYLKVGAKGGRNHCKIEFHANKKDYAANELSENMYKSIELAVYKLEKQLRRDHDFKVSKRRHQKSLKELDYETEPVSVD